MTYKNNFKNQDSSLQAASFGGRTLYREVIEKLNISTFAQRSKNYSIPALRGKILKLAVRVRYSEYLISNV